MQKVFFNRALKILLVTDSLILFSNAMMGPIYALFVQKIGGDLLDASITWAIFTGVTGLVTLISGRYVDKIKENELIIVAGYALNAFGYFLYLFVNTIPFLFFVQIIMGLSMAIYAPAFDAVYSKHLDSHRSGRQWAAWESMNYFALALGAIIGGLLVNYFGGFHVIFILMMILCLSSATFIFLLPRKVL